MQDFSHKILLQISYVYIKNQKLKCMDIFKCFVIAQKSNTKTKAAHESSKRINMTLTFFKS